MSRIAKVLTIVAGICFVALAASTVALSMQLDQLQADINALRLESGAKGAPGNTGPTGPSGDTGPRGPRGRQATQVRS